VSDGSQDDTNNGGFSRELGLLAALGIGLGTMMGAGIFVLTADAARQAGPGAVVSFIIAGLIVLPIAMTISELVTAMPEDGGSYHLISRTLGPMAATVVGAANWIGLMFATGFYLIGFAGYVGNLAPAPEWVSILAAGLFFIWLNYRGAKATGIVQDGIVGILILILLLFIGRGLFNVQPEQHEPFFPEGWGAAIGVVGLIIVSFTGFEKISTVAEEIKNPGRNLPRAIIGSVIIATVIYAGVVYVFTGVVDYEQIANQDAPLVNAAREFMGAIGVNAMAIGGILATASSANAAILASSRINYAMGRDRVLPGWFGEIHSEHHTPHRAIMVTGGVAIALAYFGGVQRLAEISSALFMVSYALLVAGLILMRRASPDWYKPHFRVPLYPWLPAAGGIASLAVILTLDRFSQISGLGLAAVALGWYYFWVRKRTNVEGELDKYLEEEQPLEKLKDMISRDHDNPGNHKE
jgi:basic amino acid/polyamine antiporter, APA family